MENYTLDIKRSGRQFICRGFRRGDTGFRTLAFHLTLDGSPFPIPKDCIATLYATLPDGTVVYQPLSVTQSSLIYSLCGSDGSTAAVTALPGIVSCEIRIADSEGHLLTCPAFAFLIEDVIQDDGAIEAKESFSALTEALGRVLEAEAGLDSKLDRTEGIYGNAMVFGADGSVLDFGAPPTASLVFYFDENGTYNTENRALSQRLAALINEKKPVAAFIFDGVRTVPASAEADSSGTVTVMAGLEDACCYLEIVIYPNRIMYNYKDTVDTAFTESGENPATQKAIANWVRNFVNESVAEGEW